MTYCFLIFMVSILAVMDLKTSRVPNKYVLTMGLVLGICYILERPLFILNWRSLMLSLLLSILLYKTKVLGAADLKVLMTISPFFDEKSLIFILLCSMLLFTLVMLVIRRLNLKKTIKHFSVGIVDNLSTSPFIWAYILPMIICCCKIILNASG